MNTNKSSANMIGNHTVGMKDYKRVRSFKSPVLALRMNNQKVDDNIDKESNEKLLSECTDHQSSTIGKYMIDTSSHIQTTTISNDVGIDNNKIDVPNTKEDNEYNESKDEGCGIDSSEQAKNSQPRKEITVSDFLRKYKKRQSDVGRTHNIITTHEPIKVKREVPSYTPTKQYLEMRKSGSMSSSVYIPGSPGVDPREINGMKNSYASCISSQMKNSIDIKRSYHSQYLEHNLIVSQAKDNNSSNQNIHTDYLNKLYENMKKFSKGGKSKYLDWSANKREKNDLGSSQISLDINTNINENTHGFRRHSTIIQNEPEVNRREYSIGSKKSDRSVTFMLENREKGFYKLENRMTIRPILKNKSSFESPISKAIQFERKFSNLELSTGFRNTHTPSQNVSLVHHHSREANIQMSDDKRQETNLEVQKIMERYNKGVGRIQTQQTTPIAISNNRNSSKSNMIRPGTLQLKKNQSHLRTDLDSHSNTQVFRYKLDNKYH